MKIFLFNKVPRAARIVEVGPRDGLQNESVYVSLKDKIKLIEMLSSSGLKTIEVGSFVSPQWVPQMRDTENIFRHFNESAGVNQHNMPSFSALTPNMKGKYWSIFHISVNLLYNTVNVTHSQLGLESAIALGVKEIAVFGAASQTFSMKNINCSINTSIERFSSVCKVAIENKIKVRGYVSCVLGCPYEGFVHPLKVEYITKKLLDLGCYEVSLGDTIGVGTPGSTAQLLEHILSTSSIPADKLAVHFHDTYGQVS